MASSTSTRKTPQLEVPPSPFERPKLNTTRTNAHRLPPPALFQGPPSKNASHISLVLPTDRVPGAPGSDPEHSHPQRITRPSRVPPASSFSGSSLRQPAIGADDHRAEDLWAEMQKTLADVELSAMNTSHVFGSSHARALEELRTAQLSLAQTWAKSEAHELLEHDFDKVEAKANVSPLDTGSSPPGKKPASDRKPSAFTNNKNLEEETERDIQLARKRREANDRYFQQVNKGVLDVVSKLDEVAVAMRRVERESREIWDESSDEAGSATASDGEGELESIETTDQTDSPTSVKKQG